MTRPPGLRRPWSSLAAALALAAGLSAAGRADTGPIDVDVALVLAVDVSYSMDPEEQALQRQGYLDAIRSPAVLDAIKKGINGRVAMAYVEWAGSQSQDLVADWQVIDGPESAQAFADRIASKPVRRLYRTSISGALDFASGLFEENGLRALKRVIDVSGDGSNNQGRMVTAARDDVLAKGIIINGLPIMLNRPNFGYPDVEQLDLYYKDCVTGGPGSFVIPIRDRDQFVDAIRSKILLEVSQARPEEPETLVVPAQTEEPRVSCTIGERMWQQRMGN